MGISAGIVGGIGALSGLFGGGSNQPTAPQMYQFQNMPGADIGAFSGIGNLGQYTNLGQFGLGQGQNIFSSLMNNPGAAGYLGGAQTAGALGQSQALGQFGLGNAISGAGMGLLPYAQSIVGTAMDPQNALYNRTLQQTQDQTRAGLEARGLDMTPYGAGVEGQTMGNFNIDWQNNQLGRQIAGMQAAGGLTQQGTGIAAGGQALAAGAPGQFLQASGMPYNVFGQIGQGQFGALNSLLGVGQSGQNLAQTQIGDYLNYLQAGTSANQVANQNYGLQLQAQAQQFNENMAFGGMLGNSLYGIGMGGFNPMQSMFSGGGNSFFPSSSFMNHGFGWG